MTIKNEFSDMQDSTELENRKENEILPLPLLYVLENSLIRKQITDSLQGKITKQKAQKISELAMDTTQIKRLKKQMFFLERKEVKLLNQIKLNGDILKLLLRSSLMDF